MRAKGLVTLISKRLGNEIAPLPIIAVAAASYVVLDGT